MTVARDEQLHERRQMPGSANEFHLAMSEEAHDQVEHILFEDPDTKHLGERGVICIITPSTGKERVTYLVHDVLEPTGEAIDYGGGHSVQFKADYRKRAIDRAREVGDKAGILYVHTHRMLPFEPNDAGVSPSKGDLDTARRDLFDDAKRLYADDRVPLAIGIVKEESRRWTVLGYEFDTPNVADDIEKPAYSDDSGQPRLAHAVRIVGEAFEKRPGRDSAGGVAGATAPIDEKTLESTVNLWGQQAQERLGALRVGLVGLGGGGSILAEHLARMGVGELVLVDFDRVEHANLNRAQGATEADAAAGVPKTEIAGRLARLGATVDHFRAHEQEASIVESRRRYGAIDRLLDCDIVLHAAEGAWPTRVLDEVAHAHLIPVISGGSNLLNERGVLTQAARSTNIIAGPGQPCQRCARHWSPDSANDEMTDPEVGPDDYNLGDGTEDDERDPSTNAVNLIVAGMMALRLQDFVLGVSGHQVGIRRFLPGTWEMESGLSACNPDCEMKSMLADGDTAQLTLSADPEYRKIRR